VFSPDGKTLASAGDDGVIRLWETNTAQQRLEIKAGTRCLSFSPDGRKLASSHADTTVLVWDVTGRLRDGRLPAVALTARQLQELWKVLGQEDAAAAHQAIWRLVAGSEQSLHFLKKQLHAVPAKELAAKRRRIAQWIADLDDDKFAKRQQATAALSKLGAKVRPDLRRALEGNPSPEVRQRIEAILAAMKDQGRFPDELRIPVSWKFWSKWVAMPRRIF